MNEHAKLITTPRIAAPGASNLSTPAPR